MRPPLPPPLRVALLIETSNRYGRDLVHGVRDWMHEQGARWAIRFTEYARGAPPPAWLAAWRGDGVIARVDSPAVAAALRKTGRPVADVSAERERSEFPRVSIDNGAVARLAADYFAGRGFRVFAFVGDARYVWSGERARAFRARLAETGGRVAVFGERRRADRPTGSAVELDALAEWLAVLPKPVAVFAAWDGRAQQVLEACQLRDLRVPGEVAVLGVDNDEVVCELGAPPLSSVLPNARRSGYEAAGLLADMMRGGTRAARTRMVEPVRVVERASTAAVAVADVKVAAAVRFIEEHAAEKIDVADVLRAVPMSRTLLERRFRAELGCSPHRWIVQRKLARVRPMLAESELSIAVVAELAGFESPSYFSVAFRRETGESPFAFRARHRPPRLRRGVTNDQ